MEPIERSWENYERQRRRLNTRLGLIVFALLPLPAILIAVGLSPLRMVLGRQYRNSLPVVVENEAQSTSYFGCGKANAADCLDLPAKWVFLQPRSNVVLLGGWQGRRIGQRGIRRCGRLTAGLLVLLR